MLAKPHKTPFPYAGGKADAAAHVWAALGDCAHYVDPFCGTLAVPLRRPHPANRPYHSETVNDADGLLVNALRGIKLSPGATAAAASNEVAEADLHARHLALVRWRESRNLELLMGDPDWHDPKMGGWWIWGISCWIGTGWCTGKGPWHADADGRFVKQDRSPAREPGVFRQLPHLGNHGMGVNRPAVREPGVERKRPHLSNQGMGVNRPGSREPGVGESPYHPATMPEVLRWFQFLSARLRHVRILNGDWRRCVTRGASKTLNVLQTKSEVCGVFFDPPYGHAADRHAGLYANDSLDVAADVRAWCVEHGGDPDYRIVLAGFEGEHDELEKIGWRAVPWFKDGHLKGGYALLGGGAHQQHRERLWLSPHCLKAAGKRQSSLDLFATAAE